MANVAAIKNFNERSYLILSYMFEYDLARAFNARNVKTRAVQAVKPTASIKIQTGKDLTKSYIENRLLKKSKN